MTATAPLSLSPPLQPAPPGLSDPSVIELRRYALRTGRRDALIQLFDREFVEPQEACGMRVIGQFRDIDHPDLFVWLRGFSGMQARRRALQSFYGGPVWAAHRDAANATMADSDDVHLLRPAWPGAAAGLPPPQRAQAGEIALPPGRADIALLPLHAAPGPELLAQCRERLTPCWLAAGARAVAWYATEEAPNSFPRLPVREGVHRLMCLILLRQAAAPGIALREAIGALQPWLAGPAELHRLRPTARSALHG